MKPFLTSFLVYLLFVGSIAIARDEKYSIPPPEFFRSNPAGKPAVISPGDVLTVRFYLNPELNKTVRVREDGKISLDLFQGIPVAGQTPEDLQTALVGMYSKEFTKPEITVDLESRVNNSAFVTGEVLLPGAKEVHAKMTVAMVLAMSQVNQRTGGIKNVFLIRNLEDGKYHVYKLNASFSDGPQRDVQVAPGDVLFVPRKGIIKADDFVEQWFRELLPATPTANASVIYTPNSTTLNTVTTAK